jgi:hypothetical protein
VFAPATATAPLARDLTGWLFSSRKYRRRVVTRPRCRE